MNVALCHSNKQDTRGYISALAEVGISTVSNPSSLEGLHGMLLCGGVDVNPALYGEDIGPFTEQPCSVRDERELTLLDEAIREDLPVLGICRGMQLINVYHFGTLKQDLGEDRPHHRTFESDRKGAAAAVHSVDFCDETLLSSLYDPSTPHAVNSRHHQAVNRLGRLLSLAASASDDGVPEAIERQDLTFCVGVQWHPEDRVDVPDGDSVLFRAFSNAVKRSVLRAL